MASADSDTPGTSGAPGAGIPLAVKILIAGGFGVGKTTMVGSVSEIAPLSTEEVMTEASMGVDDLGGVEEKTTTTVALDFGRITVTDQVVLYLFGTPGQGRFWFMWDELAEGALGAVVLADTRRLDTCFPAVDFFEHRRVPFVVAVNQFDGACGYGAEEVREAVDLAPDVPVLFTDARDRAAGKAVLLALVEHVMRRRSPAPAARPLR
ncbi:ATP/GTP-binding protein [Streptomonospora nanhaiensis]|uniref:Signal recognition particle receptor subunit beta n=1 Tax=Streptomonospora nanhaiensis TaxID=1323731 RepID=A0A853BUT9_9ACTN|nr:ATP/GTP-binding protein [Streptomonospora nanhaiensis]MBV2364906.1 ATP/GTP-binding protein [Streptomonospora nanhaiensis]MBX9389840.1 ATP/GTP-binding protein [Streptomonospora nanhaiensis]NYI98853.1 signal recognition particle receptor subunit beta [Streptomonospora nanhaiensis]